MCVCLSFSELVWPSWNDSLRAMSNSFPLPLSLSLSSSSSSSSVSRANLCYALLTCQSCFFHQHWHPWRRREEDDDDDDDAPSHVREARSRSSNETIVVLHTKLSCCFYWCYSSVTMRNVTPRQLCQCARLYTYIPNNVYTWTFDQPYFLGGRVTIIICLWLWLINWCMWRFLKGLKSISNVHISQSIDYRNEWFVEKRKRKR